MTYFFYTSFCQCRASKLACKGLRATIFIRRRHFAKMQKTKVLMRQHCAPYIRSEGSHRRSAVAYTLSLLWWDISLALNMTKKRVSLRAAGVAIPSKKCGAYTLSLWSWDISLTLNMTRFFLHVILSMSSEQTCLQGFANDDIHKAQAFCKNAKR